jgi:hypothetical protein
MRRARKAFFVDDRCGTDVAVSGNPGSHPLESRADGARMIHGEGEKPLGVRADAGLNAGQLRSLAVLHGYDLGPVRERLLRTELLTPALVDLMIFEFRRYLGLRLVQGRSVPMLSRAVDEVWHTALLYTRLYADLCEQVFGSFVHHDPATEAWPDVDERWNDFSASYHRLYGPLGILWDNARRAP